MIKNLYNIREKEGKRIFAEDTLIQDCLLETLVIHFYQFKIVSMTFLLFHHIKWHKVLVGAAKRSQLFHTWFV